MLLKANKTSLYTLAIRYFPNLPPVKQMNFCKVPRSRAYFLESYGYKIHFGACMGTPILSENASGNHQSFHLAIDELRQLNMIEE